MTHQRIAILGAGPTGLSLAVQLLQRQDAEVHLYEREAAAGGLAGSFSHRGLWFDFGSHRLHPAVAPTLLADVSRLLGPDLLTRPRRGRIRIADRLVSYPLRPLELATRLPPSFAAAAVRDMLAHARPRAARDHDSYASALLEGLGPTLCEAFYFPFARKLWGAEPAQLSAIQAQRRVSAGSSAQMLRRLLAALPGLRGANTGHSYYYPRQGFGQISQALAARAQALGAHFHMGHAVTGVQVEPGHGVTIRSGAMELTVDRAFSTLPITTLAACARPITGEAALAGQQLRYRSMVLCYLILGTECFSPYDAHYFPASGLCMSRVSEGRNYYDDQETKGLTGLCVELPCWTTDPVWSEAPDAVAGRVLEDLARAGLPVRAPVLEAFVRRQEYAYPVYDLGFEAHLSALEEWVGGLAGVVTLGRQGLFAHDNIHHAMEMAYRASECLLPGGAWDAERWQAYRQGFREHVVVD